MQLPVLVTETKYNPTLVSLTTPPDITGSILFLSSMSLPSLISLWIINNIEIDNPFHYSIIHDFIQTEVLEHCYEPLEI